MDWERLHTFIAEEEKRLKARYGVDAPGTEWYLAHFVKLSEEVGELAEQVLAAQSLQRTEKNLPKSNEALADEVADVIICTMMIAYDMNVDVPAALKHKIAKIEARYNQS
jgi:NTP pyrophosphatase (non-canonical NTP hydrolase)